jgi:hypothetical protein
MREQIGSKALVYALVALCVVVLQVRFVIWPPARGGGEPSPPAAETAGVAARAGGLILAITLATWVLIAGVVLAVLLAVTPMLEGRVHPVPDAVLGITAIAACALGVVSAVLFRRSRRAGTGVERVATAGFAGPGSGAAGVVEASASDAAPADDRPPPARRRGVALPAAFAVVAAGLAVVGIGALGYLPELPFGDRDDTAASRPAARPATSKASPHPARSAAKVSDTAKARREPAGRRRHVPRATRRPQATAGTSPPAAPASQPPAAPPPPPPPEQTPQAPGSPVAEPPASPPSATPLPAAPVTEPSTKPSAASARPGRLPPA